MGVGRDKILWLGGPDVACGAHVASPLFRPFLEIFVPSCEPVSGELTITKALGFRGWWMAEVVTILFFKSF